MTLFAVEGLRVRFGTVQAVEDVSFAVEAGRTLAIVGESGSGKSVSLLGAAGLLPATARVGGSVRLDGREILGLPTRRLRRLRGPEIGFVFQDPLSSLHPLKTVGEQVGEAITVHRRLPRKAVRARVLDLLAQVGIADAPRRIDDYPHQFSGGMRQRVMIATAIALDPKLIIADEPTTALDVTVQAAVLDLLKRLQERRGTAMIFVSHDLAVVSDIADHIAVMRAGRVVESAGADALYAHPRETYTKLLLAAARHGAVAEAAAPPPAASRRREILSASHLERSFPVRAGGPPRQVLHDISFTLDEGEILGLVGESGSGKTTIGRIVAGLVRPDAGGVSLDGRAYAAPGHGASGLDPALRTAIQVVFQDPYGSLNPRRRIGAILAEPFLINTRLAPAEIRARVADLLRLVELHEDLAGRYPVQLSGGQRQRVAIARAVALRPRVIVADEPVSALDITTQGRITALLRDLRDRLGLSILFISHDLGVVSDLCERVLVLERGKVVEYGPTASVFRAPRHPYTRALLDAVPGRRRAGVVRTAGAACLTW